MSLGLNSAGVVVVTGIAIVRNHDMPFNTPHETKVVVHVHHGEMSANPEAADYVDLRKHRLPSFIISADGENIWEIAMIGGVNKYRAVLPSSIGEWVDFSGNVLPPEVDNVRL
jgi:hypothetical protein